VRTIIAAAIFTIIFAAFSSPLAAQTVRPTFLFLLEGKGVSTGTIHVFRVNSSTGAISEVPGSPFNAGLIPQQLVVDPTGRFIYVTNNQSEDITALSVDAATGALTELPGSPFPIRAAPVTSAVDPTGQFLYVFATNLVNGVEEEFLYEYKIDSATGILTAASSSPTIWELGPGILITAIAFDPAGNYAYLGQVTGGNLGAPTLVCSVDFSSGALTAVGSVQPAPTGEADHIGVSPSGSFLYSINTTFSEANAFTIGSGGGVLAEISGSPYSVPYGPSSLVVHPAGNFLYVANSNSTFQAPPTTGPVNGSIYAFAINSGTGALTQVSGSPYATGIDPLSIVVDPTGSYAYWTSTSNTTGTPFAQIMGCSIDASSGVLTPLSWTPWTDSVTSYGDQLVVSFGPPAAPNPVPMISSLSPPSTNAGGAAFTLQVNGANFVPGATVYFGGQPRSTTVVNSTQLNASILASDIDNDGTVVIFAFNPLPGGGASTSVEFPVPALSPIISAINPSSVPAAASPFALFVGGSNFVTSSVVNFNGTAQATNYISPILIYTEILSNEIAAQGAASITVTTPSNGVPGGGTSNPVTLTILPPTTQPVVTNISPTSATGGGAAFTLTVNGSGFVQGSQVSFNMNNVSTTFVNSTQLTAAIPASAIAVAGYPNVIVTNPGGLVSVPLPFTVMNPPPGGGSVSPPSLPAGSNALPLKVTGTGFTQDSVVLVNNSKRMTTYMSSTLLQATLLPSDLAQGGTLNITVMNPPPGGGTTAGISFTVADYKVTPASSTPPVTAGQTANFALTVSPFDGTFSNPVTFRASGLPTGATDSFAPSGTITPGATPQTVTLSIATTPHMAESTVNFPQGCRPVWPWLCLAGLAFALAWLSLRASGGGVRRLAPQLFLALLMVAAAGLVACGAVGVGPSSPPQLNPATGTPAGTYPIIVTATSGGVSHSATITLTVM
jgi:6-phosphogluconolactonase (cycloisomerase 2 family)